MNATIVRCTATVGLFVAQGCAAGKIGPATSGGDWTRTLAQAEAAASERRYAVADRLLADFAVRNPGTPGAVESAYWRGVVALEPGEDDEGLDVVAPQVVEGVLLVIRHPAPGEFAAVAELQVRDARRMPLP